MSASTFPAAATVPRAKTSTVRWTVPDEAFVVVILLLCYTYFVPKTGDKDWVANSRAALTYAIVDQGVLHIDAYHESTGDKAYYRGHYYIVGSIGPSLLAVPAYATFKTLACWLRSAASLHMCGDPGDQIPPVHPPRYARWALIVITFLTISLPAALLGALIYRLMQEMLCVSRGAFALALLYGLGTVAFPYSRAFYQHQVAASGLAFGFYLLWRVAGGRAPAAWLWVVGLLFGLTAISEYPLVFALAALFMWAAYVLPRRRDLWRVVVGALPPLLALAAYNYEIFGTPLPVAYRYHVIHHDLHAQGFMGMSTPTLEAFYGITISPLRGLFFVSPFLALMLPGLYWLWREHHLSRALVVALTAAISSFFLYNSAYRFWNGGYSIGPRYLVPMLPLAMLPVAVAFERAVRGRAGRVLIVILCAASVLNVWAQTIAGQYYPALSLDEVPQNNPLWQHAVPSLLAGDIAQNYGHYLGLSGFWSVLPLGISVAVLLGIRAYLRPRVSHLPARSQSNTDEAVAVSDDARYRREAIRGDTTRRLAKPHSADRKS